MGSRPPLALAPPHITPPLRPSTRPPAPPSPQLRREPAVAAAGPSHVLLAALGSGSPHLPPHAALLPGVHSGGAAREPSHGCSAVFGGHATARPPTLCSRSGATGIAVLVSMCPAPAVCCMAGPPPDASRLPPPCALQSPRNVTGSRSGLLKCFVRRVSPSPLSNRIWRRLQPAAPH